MNDRQAGRQAVMQADRQADRQKDGHMRSNDTENMKQMNKNSFKPETDS